jgi:polyisoprenoid-binding protein YceI
MKHTINQMTVLALITAGLMTGCAKNPADDAPEAKTSTPGGTKTSEVAADAVKYVIDPGSTIKFVGAKVTGQHEGGFNEFTGYFHISKGELTGSDHKFTIDMESTWSDAEKLTGHLKHEDFFNVAKYPEAVFELKSVTGKQEGSTRTLVGDLDFHGVRKQLEIDADVTEKDGVLSIKSAFSLDRFAFDIAYPGKKDNLIKQNVLVTVDITAKPEK